MNCTLGFKEERKNQQLDYHSVMTEQSITKTHTLLLHASPSAVINTFTHPLQNLLNFNN